MTTPPKARKYRIRRSASSLPQGGAAQPIADPAGAPQPAQQPAPNAAAPQPEIFAPTEDGFGNQSFPGSAAHARAQARPQAQPQTQAQAQAQPQAQAAQDGMEISPEQELAAIRQEGLTGRQLRMARRAAQKQGLSPASDFDAVRLLRKRGIDPFGRSNMLELIQTESGLGASNAGGAGGGGGAPLGRIAAPAPGNGPQNLPATVRQPQLPSTQVGAPPIPMDEASRAMEIMRVQRDIASRRRKRLALLGVRLLFFVLLPTLIVGYYFFAVATPMYATNSEFIIQKAEAPSPSTGGLGGLMAGGGFATVQESITVQSYLTSREALLRLDEELGFRAHFSGPDMDPLTRLAPDATDEEVYKTYLRHLTIGYDPTEGLVRMEVQAADPMVSQGFSEALIQYAEERVDQMSQRLREDQMAGAREGYDEAEQRMREAQDRVLELQERRGVLSADAEVSTVFQQISNFEMQAQEERLRLSELNSNARPNATRVGVAERNIARLDALIEQLRSGLVESETGGASLARVQSELIIAESDLQTRQDMLGQALQQMETSRVEANRQTLYLSTGVFPVAPDEAAYPRSLENTLLAFLVFAGIYLMVSMTASILKEQVSA